MVEDTVAPPSDESPSVAGIDHREVARAIKAKVDDLNETLERAAKIGLKVEIEVLDTTRVFHSVPRYILQVGVFAVL